MDGNPLLRRDDSRPEMVAVCRVAVFFPSPTRPRLCSAPWQSSMPASPRLGGIGQLVRHYGLIADHVRAVEAVLPDGGRPAPMPACFHSPPRGIGQAGHHPAAQSVPAMARVRQALVVPCTGLVSFAVPTPPDAGRCRPPTGCSRTSLPTWPRVLVVGATGPDRAVMQMRSLGGAANDVALTQPPG